MPTDWVSDVVRVSVLVSVCEEPPVLNGPSVRVSDGVGAGDSPVLMPTGLFSTPLELDVNGPCIGGPYEYGASAE